MVTTSSPLKLSVTIITKNEGDAIYDCLESVRWADEIVVVDSGSADNTVEICRSFGAKVLVTEDWPGFGMQKNRALNLATNAWVLSIDADERVSAALREEIEAVIQQSSGDFALRMPRQSSYCGQFVRYSGWWPYYVIRLFPRKDAKFSDDLVHERILFSGEIRTLKNPLLHISYKNLEEVLEKTNRYSTAGAIMLHRQGKTASLSGAVARGCWAFFRTYVIRLGFLDGRVGFMLAISNAETTYYKYLKLYFLQSAR